jgi:hypothetical protein
LSGGASSTPQVPRCIRSPALHNPRPVWEVISRENRHFTTHRRKCRQCPYGRQTGGYPETGFWEIARNESLDFPDKSSAWAEVERLHLALNPVDSRRGVAFADLAQHNAEHELVDRSESIHPKAHTTIKGYDRVLRNRLLPKWGSRIAPGIQPLEIIELDRSC